MSDIIKKYSRALKLYRDDGISIPVLPSEARFMLEEIERLRVVLRTIADFGRDNPEFGDLCAAIAEAGLNAQADQPTPRAEK